MSRNDEMIEITGELRQDRPASWGIWQGDHEDVIKDHTTGELMRREKLVFLPKSQCRKGERKNEFLVPEWLAQEKGLI